MRTARDHDHLSYSQVNTYLSCPLQYRFKYIDEIPPAFTSVALVFGSAIHEAVAAFHQSRLEGEQLRADQMLDVYRDQWRQAEQVKYFNGDNENSLTEKAKNMLTVFHASADMSTQVIGVEEFFEIPLGGLPLFQGYIDLIEESPDESVTLVDLKTASKKLSQSNVDTNLQLTAYALATESMGFNPDELTFRLDVLLKTKEAGMVRYETTRTADDRYRFIKLLYSVWNEIQQDVFFPRKDWQCVQCAWAKNCEEW
jgi:putative RecB family exonuclease